MSIRLGKLKDGRPVFVDDLSPNQHILMVGMSGTGKSTCCFGIKNDIVEQGGTVVEIDISGDKNGFPTADKMNKISALQDGIDLHFLNQEDVNGKLENYANFLTYTTDILSGTMGLGIRQQGVLRDALEYAIEHRDTYDSEMEAICAGLEMQNSAVAQSVKNKLWNILKSGIFRKGEKHMEREKINIVSLQGINPVTQKELAEIILACIWRKARKNMKSFGGLTLVIDEFQNLSLKKNSTLFEMLREARGYGINLVLATQSLSGFSTEIKAAIDQTAVQLYFRPSNSDVTKIARCLEPGNEGHWTMVLRNLQVGQFVVSGNIKLQEKKITRPLIIQTEPLTTKKGAYLGRLMEM